MERPALDQDHLRSLILENSTLWRHLELVRRTGSTNADLMAGANTERYPFGSVLVAEEQFAGRGRLDRSWQGPPRSGLAVSVLLPSPEGFEPTLMPLLVGVAATRAIRARSGLAHPEQVGLKWPNDVMIGERKVGGILTHQIGAKGKKAIVAGLGLNVSLTEEELPTSTATSLLLAGATESDRSVYLDHFLHELENLLTASDTDSLISEYLSVSLTIGREVMVELPGTKRHFGVATTIDSSGALVLADGFVFSAGDVVHLRGVTS